MIVILVIIVLLVFLLIVVMRVVHQAAVVLHVGNAVVWFFDFGSCVSLELSKIEHFILLLLKLFHRIILKLALHHGGNFAAGLVMKVMSQVVLV